MLRHCPPVSTRSRRHNKFLKRWRTHGGPLEMVRALRYRKEIAERIRHAIRAKTGETVLRPVYDLMQATGSSRHVAFSTRKPVYAATKSHVNYVVCDPANKNASTDHLWEYLVAEAFDAHAAVKTFVKNDHLDFIIRYKFEDSWANYLPDFIVVVAHEDGSDINLIVEVKGEEDNRDRAKYTFARSWVDAVNRDGQHGQWSFAVVKDPTAVARMLTKVAKGGVVHGGGG